MRHDHSGRRVNATLRLQLTFISTTPHGAEVDLGALGFEKVRPRVLDGVERNEIWVRMWMLEHLGGRRRDTGFPDFRADALNARIIQGCDFTVSLLGDSSKEPEVEKLENLHEAWAICYRTPRPGWRLFGRLYGQGTFVASDLKDRHELGGRENYNRIAAAAMADLDGALAGMRPHTGTSEKDYFLGLARNVDKPAIF
ncbi:hypothetical protein MKK69_16470 [Methylobacterium sp. J-026]|uniref:hypothetical protein n=1 Tax=Methylobacterium sp. J-026 TaxID=2836624 RepID=UPI001FB8B5FE|nr:hypothetical protein [Methylobacterium sp. J-026]MCJ2135627.1 hypothetical protein [Methylobacterium sp. J-026]